MRKLLKLLVLAAVVAAGIGWFVTAPSALPNDAFDGVSGDPARGETVFTAAGCASCHMAPGAEDEAKLVLAGGQRFPSPFGTFLAPNISMDPEHGIGDWTARDLGNALLHGTSPDGQHYFPAFPYTSYAKMADRDIADLWAYMQTLPASDTPSQPHEVGFPFNIRRSLGGWKTLFLKSDWVMQGDDLGPEGGGSITAFYTVLTEADAQNDPIADSARAILDGHIVLSRHLADGGMYPAIDIEQSISRAMNQITTEQQQHIANSLKKSFSLYEQNRDLINVGAYQSGTDKQLDAAIQLHPYLLQFLSQGMREKVDITSSNEQLTALYSGMEEIQHAVGE